MKRTMSGVHRTMDLAHRGDEYPVAGADKAGGHAVELPHQRLVQGLVRGAVGGHPAVVEGHHPLGIEHGMLWVVTGEQDGVPPQGQGGHPLQHPHLVAEVQGGGGLVHQQQPGLLGQSPGRQYKLLLSTGQLREAPVGVVCDPQSSRASMAMARPGGPARRKGPPKAVGAP